MSNPTFNPTQIGYTPTGSVCGSQVVIGKDMTSSWEAIGYGAAGRPDPLDRLYINISQISGVNPPVRKATVAFDVKSLLNIIAANPNAPTTGFYFAFRELQVCNGSTTQAMTFLASQPYTAV